MGQYIEPQEILLDENKSRLETNELAGQLQITALSAPPLSSPNFQTESARQDQQTLQDINMTLNNLLPKQKSLKDDTVLPPPPTPPTTWLEDLQEGDQELWELL
ncbi:hypothetical protein INT44_009372 [Umbelopsis vinacea]|uniref:Uncharacterized protein n=1 Tax=Umbelopsis vinacea TaxID=44442 RepID=A0A8H7UJT5_9FUNG|nr:hypothetical protein INT44_009372 [Umbelopsis vinacea]